MFYSETEILASIKEAYSQIFTSKKSLLGWKWSKNECWSLFCRYDTILRAGKGKIEGKVIGYTSDSTFMRKFHEAGFPTFDYMFTQCGYQLVPASDKRLGDVAIARGLQYNTTTALIDTGRGWLNSGPEDKYDLIPYNMVSKIYVLVDL